MINLLIWAKVRVLFVVVFLLVPFTQCAISDLRVCVDERCEVPISKGRTTLNYAKHDPALMSFNINEQVVIFSKEAGVRRDLWGVEINGQRGYAPFRFIQELQILNRPRVTVPTEPHLQHAGVPPPPELHSSQAHFQHTQFPHSSLGVMGMPPHMSQPVFAPPIVQHSSGWNPNWQSHIPQVPSMFNQAFSGAVIQPTLVQASALTDTNETPGDQRGAMPEIEAVEVAASDAGNIVDGTLLPDDMATLDNGNDEGNVTQDLLTAEDEGNLIPEGNPQGNEPVSTSNDVIIEASQDSEPSAESSGASSDSETETKDDILQREVVTSKKEPIPVEPLEVERANQETASELRETKEVHESSVNVAFVDPIEGQEQQVTVDPAERDKTVSQENPVPQINAIEQSNLSGLAGQSLLTRRARAIDQDFPAFRTGSSDSDNQEDKTKVSTDSGEENPSKDTPAPPESPELEPENEIASTQEATPLDLDELADTELENEEAAPEESQEGSAASASPLIEAEENSGDTEEEEEIDEEIETQQQAAQIDEEKSRNVADEVVQLDETRMEKVEEESLNTPQISETQEATESEGSLIGKVWKYIGMSEETPVETASEASAPDVKEAEEEDEAPNHTTPLLAEIASLDPSKGEENLPQETDTVQEAALEQETNNGDVQVPLEVIPGTDRTPVLIAELVKERTLDEDLVSDPLPLVEDVLHEGVNEYKSTDAQSIDLTEPAIYSGVGESTDQPMHGVISDPPVYGSGANYHDHDYGHAEHDHHSHGHGHSHDHGHSHGHDHVHNLPYIPGFRHHYKPPPPPPPPTLQEEPANSLPEVMTPHSQSVSDSSIDSAAAALTFDAFSVSTPSPLDAANIPYVYQEPPQIEPEAIIHPPTPDNYDFKAPAHSEKEESGGAGESDVLVEKEERLVASLIAMLPAFLAGPIGDWERQGLSFNVTALLFVIGHVLVLLFAVNKLVGRSERTASLLKKLCIMDAELHEMKVRQENVQEELRVERLTLTELKLQQEEELGRANEVSPLPDVLEDVQRENEQLKAAVLALEKELEAATEAGMELNRMLSESLATQSDTQELMDSMELLQQQLKKQHTLVENLNSTVQSKSTENELLQAELEEAQETLGDLERQMQDLEDIRSNETSVKAKLEECQSDLVKLQVNHDALILEYEHQSQQLKTAMTDGHDFKSRYMRCMHDLRAREGEVQVLTSCLEKGNESNATKDGKGPTMDRNQLAELLDVGHIRAELTQALETKGHLENQLAEAAAARRTSEACVATLEAQLRELKESSASAERQGAEAQTRLEVLSNYFQEKEAQLQKELGTQEAKRMQTEGSATVVSQKLLAYEEELASYRLQVDTLKKEIDDQERSFKVRLSAQENRAHESWLTARQAERRSEEAKQEAAQLRGRLLQLQAEKEKEFNQQQQQLNSMHEADGVLKPLPHRAGQPLAANGDLHHDPLAPNFLPQAVPGIVGPPPPLDGFSHLDPTMFPPPFMGPHASLPPLPPLPPFMGPPEMPMPLHLLPPHRPPPLGMMSPTYDVDYRDSPRRFIPSPPRRYPSPPGSERSVASDRYDRMDHDRYDDSYRSSPVPYGHGSGRPRSMGRSRDGSPHRDRERDGHMYSPAPYAPHRQGLNPSQGPSDWVSDRESAFRPAVLRASNARDNKGPKTSSPITPGYSSESLDRHSNRL